MLGWTTSIPCKLPNFLSVQPGSLIFSGPHVGGEPMHTILSNPQKKGRQ